MVVVITMKKKDKIKEPMNRRTKFTIFSMFNIVWYTIVVLVASFLDHNVPSDLTIAWFSAWTVELALLFGIKINNKDDSLNGFDNNPEPSDPFSVDTSTNFHSTVINIPNNNFIITPQDEGDASDYCDDVG